MTQHEELEWLDEILEQLQYGTTMSDNQEPMLTNNRNIAKQSIAQKVREDSERHIRRAEYLNDGLRRAAEFMYQNGLLPPDTTTVDGIKSYFLNEARFLEAQLQGGKG